MMSIPGSCGGKRRRDEQDSDRRAAGEGRYDDIDIRPVLILASKLARVILRTIDFGAKVVALVGGSAARAG